MVALAGLTHKIYYYCFSFAWPPRYGGYIGWLAMRHNFLLSILILALRRILIPLFYIQQIFKSAFAFVPLT
jgi:hypothetical protein